MTTGYDEDPAEAAEIARLYAEGQALIRGHLDELRAANLALVTARLAGIDDTATHTAAQQLGDRYGPDDVDLLVAMVERLMWDGCESIEKEALRNLKKLRDARDVAPVLDVINRTRPSRGAS